MKPTSRFPAALSKQLLLPILSELYPMILLTCVGACAASPQHSFELREIYQSTEIKLMIVQNNFSSIPYVTMRPEIRHTM